MAAPSAAASENRLTDLTDSGQSPDAPRPEKVTGSFFAGLVQPDKPFRVAIYAPPCSGKTTLQSRLVNWFGTLTHEHPTLLPLLEGYFMFDTDNLWKTGSPEEVREKCAQRGMQHHYTYLDPACERALVFTNFHGPAYEFLESRGFTIIQLHPSKEEMLAHIANRIKNVANKKGWEAKFLKWWQEAGARLRAPWIESQDELFEGLCTAIKSVLLRDAPLYHYFDVPRQAALSLLKGRRWLPFLTEGGMTVSVNPFHLWDPTDFRFIIWGEDEPECKVVDVKGDRAVLNFTGQKCPTLVINVRGLVMVEVTLGVGATAWKKTAVMCYVFFSKADPSVNAVRNLIKQSPLHAAVRENSLSGVMHALSTGTPVDVMDAFGRTPLMYAVWYGRREIARILIQRDADPKLSALCMGGNAISLADRLVLHSFHQILTQPPIPSMKPLTIAHLKSLGQSVALGTVVRSVAGEKRARLEEPGVEGAEGAREDRQV